LVSWSDPLDCNLEGFAGRTAHRAKDQRRNARLLFVQLETKLRSKCLPSSGQFAFSAAPSSRTPLLRVSCSLYFFSSLLHDLCIHQLVNVACIWIGKPATKSIDLFPEQASNQVVFRANCSLIASSLSCDGKWIPFTRAYFFSPASPS